MATRSLALAALALTLQGCAFSLQTDPGDLAELKSLLLADTAARARNANPTAPAQVIVISPSPTSAHVPDIAAAPRPPKPVTRKFADTTDPRTGDSDDQ